MGEKRLVIEIDERNRIRIQHTIPEHYCDKSQDGWQEVEPKQQQETNCNIFNIDPGKALEGLTALLKAVINGGDTSTIVEHLLEKIEANI